MTMLSTAKYFEAIAELDAISFQLRAMLQTERSLSPLSRAIDAASGYDAQKMALARKLMRRASLLKKRIGADD